MLRPQNGWAPTHEASGPLGCALDGDARNGWAPTHEASGPLGCALDGDARNGWAPTHEASGPSAVPRLDYRFGSWNLKSGLMRRISPTTRSRFSSASRLGCSFHARVELQQLVLLDAQHLLLRVLVHRALEVIDLALRQALHQVEVLAAHVRQDADVLLEADRQLLEHLGHALVLAVHLLAVGVGEVVVGLAAADVRLFARLQLAPRAGGGRPGCRRCRSRPAGSRRWSCRSGT